MRASHHAWLRWNQRHPHLDMRAEFASARSPSKRLIQLLTGPRPSGYRRYLITPNDVVFVLGRDNVVVTVLNLRDARRRARAIARRDKRNGTEWM